MVSLLYMNDTDTRSSNISYLQLRSLLWLPFLGSDGFTVSCDGERVREAWGGDLLLLLLLHVVDVIMVVLSLIVNYESLLFLLHINIDITIVILLHFI